MLKIKKYYFSLILFSLISHNSYAQSTCTANANYEIGAGIYDITGPAAETGMMGYGMFKATNGRDFAALMGTCLCYRIAL